MIDVCFRMFIHWPWPRYEDDSWKEYSFSFFRWYSCPLERSLHLMRTDNQAWGVCSHF